MTAELVDTWKPFRSELIAAVDEAAFATYLSGLHLHDAGSDGLVVGCGAGRRWIQERFGRMIRRVAGETPVRFIGCRCEPQEQVTAGTVAEGLPSASAYDPRSEWA